MSKSDKSMISNAFNEVRSAAKAWKVEPWVVYYAKFCTGSNDRHIVHDWVLSNLTTIHFLQNHKQLK